MILRSSFFIFLIAAGQTFGAATPEAPFHVGEKVTFALMGKAFAQANLNMLK